jgi:prefoldin subunit 5
MSFWNNFSSKNYTKKEVEVISKVRAGYYPVEPAEEHDKIVKNATFEMIQGSIAEEITKVHAKVNTVSEQDLKIKELKDKLEKFKSDNKEIYDKIDNLKSVGLINTPSAVKVLESLKEREKHITSQITDIKGEIAELETIKLCNDKYLLKYPSFKFIDKKTFIGILKKYDLVLGESSLYAREIPDNVLTNILKFKDDINKGKTYVHLCIEYNNRGSYSHRTYVVKTSTSEHVSRHITGSDEHYFNNHSTDLRSIYNHCKTNLAIAAPISHFKNQKITVEKRREGGSGIASIDVLTVDKDTRELVIDRAAFDSVAEKNNAFERSMVKDPIACLRVPEGYIIIDAWEKEALIPEINRETLN